MSNILLLFFKMETMNKRVYLLFICLSILLVQNIFAQKKLLTNFPNGFTLKEIRSRLAYRFVNSKHALYVGKWIGYYETFTHSAAFEYAVVDKLMKLIQDKSDYLLTKEKQYLPPRNHVDLNTFGSLPLKLYKVIKKKCYFDLGMSYADSQWEVSADANPKQKEWADKGYTWQTRLWIDDMYMIPILQIEGYASVFYADNHNNKETVFEVQFKKGGYGEGSDFPNTFAPFNSGTNVVQVGGTGGNNILEMDIYNAYEDGDLRRDFSMALGYNDSRKGGKSEALNQNGKTAQACDCLNQVRRRGFGYQTTETSPVDIKTSDKNEFFLIVEHERRVELAFEGHRWFDLIRTGRASKEFKLNETNLITPIPQKQVDVNPELQQSDYQITPK